MKVADQIYDYLRRVHPAQRRAIKEALRSLPAGKMENILALTDDLEGFYRLRVDKFRIFRYLPSGEISCEYINTRDTVYEQFASMRKIIEGR